MPFENNDIMLLQLNKALFGLSAVSIIYLLNLILK